MILSAHYLFQSASIPTVPYLKGGSVVGERSNFCRVPTFHHWWSLGTPYNSLSFRIGGESQLSKSNFLVLTLIWNRFVHYDYEYWPQKSLKVSWGTGGAYSVRRKN